MVDTTEQVTEQEENMDGQRVVTRAVSHESRDEHVNRGVRIVWFLVGIIVALLLVRFILALLGANLYNAFASCIFRPASPPQGGF